MKFDLIEIGCWLDDWGYKIGGVLVALPILSDTLGLGFRGFIDWNIGKWGIICQLMGLGIIAITRHARRNW